MNQTRRFRLSDAIVLVAALAISMAIHRTYWTLLHYHPPQAAFDPRWLISEIVGASTIYVLILALTLVILARVSPRPHREVLAIRPGFMACLVLLAASAPMAILSPMSDLGEMPGLPFDILTVRTIRKVFIVGGIAVASCWFTMAMGRRWAPEPSWIDRLGRIIGLYAISAYPLRLLLTSAIEHLDRIMSIVPQSP
jgi:hypothetical protein